jgi:toxin ParE1/3/4
MKKLVRRSVADTDVLSALDYYLEHAPEYVLDFIDDLERAYRHIQSFPESGSMRYAIELDLPNLRMWQCVKYPYLVFYIDLPHQIEIWRVLHNKKDIPPTLQIEIIA